MNWNMDPAHTEILFSVRHMMISKVRGQFDEFSVSFEGDEDHPADVKVEVVIEAASINTREDQRDTHLKSPDFLDAENYPQLYFKSKRVELSDDRKAKLYGDLTIRGMTREVVLDVEYTGQSKSPYGFTSVGFEATIRLSRKDWDLTWNVPLETGGWLVGDEVDISIQLELIKQEQDEAESVA